MKAYIQYNDKQLDLKPKGMTSADELYVDMSFDKIEGGNHLKLFIHPKQKILLKKVRIEIDINTADFLKVFSNGYQSWSESREFDFNEDVPQLRKIAFPFMKYYGDYTFQNIQRGKGIIHSWTYTYLRNKNNKINLFASLNESTGYTLFIYDANKNQLIIEKDCTNLELSHSYPALEIAMLNGNEKEVFGQWFAKSGIKKPTVKPASGWTSWYNYYTKINEEIILKNLNAFKEKNIEIDIFQIDDGYQKRVGDWLDIHEDKFPKGMKALADSIHKNGTKAGLWLAPLVAEKKSSLFKNRKDLFLKDQEGKLVSAGLNPMWSGDFYPLDIYNKEVREYLSGVFYTVLHKWGYDMVKLDFLYAAAIISRPNKTRGQVMSDTMEFLRQICGDKIILGCGVPLGSSFGLVDYCRIGADIHLSWEHRALKWCHNRERLSTMSALRSVLGRWQLNNHAFLNDPDVFILRDENNKLSATQQNTILTLNSILGKLIFTSDFIGDYSDEQLSEYLQTRKWIKSEVESVLEKNGYYEICFTNEGESFKAYANLWKKEVSISVKSGVLNLEGFETMVLKD
jgi:alpha-galactosidase